MRKFHVEFRFASQKISSERRTALAMLVNEVVTNSLKYAFAPDEEGKLSVSLKKADKPELPSGHSRLWQGLRSRVR